LNRNLLRLAMLAMFALCVAGCAGIHQSGSVSPATFFLPGIMKAGPPKTGNPVSLPEPAKEFASVK
jgi:hypothetical protein